MSLWILLISGVVILHVYALYPLILWLLPVTSRRGAPRGTGRDGLFSVSILIPAYNEEGCIEAKVRNGLEQHYPADLLEILVVSDGSTDGTVEKAESFSDPRVKVIHNETRRGKNGALNAAVPLASGDILLFTDANALFDPEAVNRLAAHFNEDRVGLVCGHLKYVETTQNKVQQGEGLYFRYEALIKRLESRHGVLPVVTGSIYALRKELFSALDLDVANDFAHPVQVLARGYRVIFEKDAVAFENATSSVSEEFHRRVRIVTRGYTAFSKYWRIHGMVKGLRGFCYVSHKLLRWFVPWLLLAIFASNSWLLDSWLFKGTFVVQLLFYGAALRGMARQGKCSKLFSIPFYFCMINLAASWGFVQFLFGKRRISWTVARTTR